MELPAPLVESSAINWSSVAKLSLLPKRPTSVPFRNRQSKQKDNKKKRKKQDDSSSSSEYDKPAKKVKKVNVTKDFMFYPHVYISTIDIDEMDHSEDPSLPMENLPNLISSTVSPTYILEAPGAPIPPELLPTPVAEVPILNLASTETFPIGSFFNEYEPQSTDGLPVGPLHCWDPVTGHPWPCLCCSQ